MKLKRFRVFNFRSVEDSGWIETNDVTALVGTNESGKTNILLPLWKLNPAKEGLILPTADYPRKLYNVIRNQDPKPIFITAVFDVDDNLANELSSLTAMPIDMIREVEVSRRFDNTYDVDFPNANLPSSINAERINTIFSSAKQKVEELTPTKAEESLKKIIISTLDSSQEQISEEQIQLDQLKIVLGTLESVKTDNSSKSNLIATQYKEVLSQIKGLIDELSKTHPRESSNAVKLILENIPKFVYYSTYGNLDSEIYLPHVIKNLTRSDLGLKEQAKARTLKVLFEFVQLQPDEILELGRDFRDQNRQPTEEEISIIAEKKKQRSILLQSASTYLTKEFREWWKQGKYIFRFEADGEHFRIWVSDDKRPEEIELEGRSTGLQWFLSFYLVFLVERSDAHSGAILLLDEPGLSLHPLAQRDLSEFFNGLSKDNQLIYTCHSPFLVDADGLDRVRKVYVDEDGTSKVTADLSAYNNDVAHKGAAYAVYAALGLTVAESLLLGCKPVIVEGPSDQHYLTAIKNILISTGRLKPGREIIFPPAGGTKGVKAVASILGSRDEELPITIFDSDQQGNAMVQELRKGLFVSQPELVLQVGAFTGIDGSEVEDLIPQHVLVKQIDRWLRTSEVQFSDVVQEGKPIVPQIEAWAKENNVLLAMPGWKVELAIRVKKQLLIDGANNLKDDVLDKWMDLFNSFIA